MNILGLDISTSFVGMCLLENNTIKYIEAIDLRKEENLFLKASHMKRVLEDYKSKYIINEIYVEQSLNAFRPGLSSAQVLVLLSKFNGIVSWLCYETFGIQPQYIGATTARKSIGITVHRGENSKEIVLKNVLDAEKNFPVEYTKLGNPKAGTYDKADAYLIAKAAHLLCLQNQKK